MELIAVEPAPPDVDGDDHANWREKPVFCTGDFGVVEGTS
jgi:hypothetical protein